MLPLLFLLLLLLLFRPKVRGKGRVGEGGWGGMLPHALSPGQLQIADAVPTPFLLCWACGLLPLPGLLSSLLLP